MRLCARLFPAFLIHATTLAATGCAPYAVVEPARTRIGDAYTVEPQIRWTSLRQSGSSELWTVNGPALDSLRFFRNVGDGETLFGTTLGGPQGRMPEDKQPRFRATMTPSEIMELVVDTLTLLGASKIQATDLRPAKFGATDGFRFDLAYVWSDGVEARSAVAGAVIKQRLQLMLYTGTRLHYFDKHRPTVERIVDSVRFE